MIDRIKSNEHSRRRHIRLGVRERSVLVVIVALLLLIVMVISGLVIDPSKTGVHLDLRKTPPTLSHLFGTDWMGRDMLARTLKGLTLSLGVGVFASFLSTLLALGFSLLASWNKTWDTLVTWLIDLFLSVPHLVILILISFAAGGGFKGLVLGLALTHWPSLSRLLRAEIMQIKSAAFIGVSRRLGKSRFWIAIHHFLPHLVPQLLIGFILLFPHAILHEAAITFLGFGLSAESPAIGIILSESMKYLSVGMWWLAFFPGLALLIMVGLFDLLGRNIRRLIDPFHGQKM